MRHMKKALRPVAMLLVLTMLMAVPALAATEGDSDESTAATVTTIIDVLSGTTATFDDSNEGIINVTVTSSSLTTGNQYIILMVEGSDGNYSISEDSILYIDQTTALAVDDETASVSFAVYPSSMKSSVILVCGVVDNEAKSVVVAIIEGKYILGDVDESGKVTASDANMILKYVVGSIDLSDKQLLAADVDGSSKVSAADASKILRVVVGIDSLER